MPVPGFQEFMLPLLDLASDGKEHSLAEARTALAARFSLSEQDQNEMLPTAKQTRFSNRVAWAKSYLQQAELLTPVRRGTFQITERGRSVLAENPPHNWDIASTCSIRGVKGLVLVEAKANLPELSAQGKRTAAKPSAGSKQNHDRIAAAIRGARRGLRMLDPSIAISRDSHYQLANRVAFAWKLATLGVPVVLVYLGFHGDRGIANVGQPFASAEHWRQTFIQHIHGVLSETLIERELTFKAPLWIVIRSRPVLSQSPPA